MIFADDGYVDLSLEATIMLDLAGNTLISTLISRRASTKPSSYNLCPLKVVEADGYMNVSLEATIILDPAGNTLISTLISRRASTSPCHIIYVPSRDIRGRRLHECVHRGRHHTGSGW